GDNQAAVPTFSGSHSTPAPQHPAPPTTTLLCLDGNTVWSYAAGRSSTRHKRQANHMDWAKASERGRMRAIICTDYGPPEVLQLQEVEQPTPKGREVLIKIYATAVTVSDCIIRGGRVRPLLWLPMRLIVGFTRPRQPILGMVLAGEVEAVGKKVRRFHPGDQVYAVNPFRFGTYAEYTCLSETSVLALKPSTVTYGEAAAIPFGGLLALHFLRQGQIHSGQNVLIYGASGAIGTAAVQLARSFGASVTGVCST